MWTAFWDIACGCALPILLSAWIAYLLGSINFAIILTKAFTHSDIRDVGSGNAGATNVLRTQGVVPAILTGIGDLGKSLVAVWLGGYILTHFSAGNFDPEKLSLIGGYLAGVCCIIGHLFPIYFKFRGGKGVVATLGLMLLLDWRVALCSLFVFAVVVAITRMVSAASLSAGIAAVPATYCLSRFADHADPAVCGFCAAMMGVAVLLVFLKHIPNIRRILNGTENRFGNKDKPKTKQGE